MVVTYRF